MDKNVIVFGWGHKLPKGSLYSLSHRKLDTLVLKETDHKTVQDNLGRDDLLLLFLSYDVQHTPLNRATHLQCDDAFEEIL